MFSEISKKCNFLKKPKKFLSKKKLVNSKNFLGPNFFFWEEDF
uniref:Uncharacterized protein n=1 Tax=viral metagenome TaxID=1070528 RepID=A0A6C0BMY0_9ZZZZ